MVVAAVGAQDPGGDYRLPRSFTPLSYQLKMVPYLEEGNMRYTGTVDITVRAEEDAALSLTLHAHKDLEVKVESFVNRETQSSVLSKKNSTVNEAKQFLTIYLNHPTSTGEEYVLSLSFSNKLQRDNYGFYYSSYEFNGKTE